MVRKTRLPNASRGRDAVAPIRTPRATGRTVRGRKTRVLLLDAARVVFVRDGFLHARIADICEEAGISYGSFYTYFTSKEQIFQELLDEIEVDLLNVAGEAPDGTIYERIRSSNRHFFEQYRDNAGILAVIEQVVTFDADARARRDARERVFADVLERRVRRYQAEGLADARLDPRIAASALGAMVEASAKGMYITGRSASHDLEQVVDQLTLLWMNALGISDEEGAAPARLTPGRKQPNASRQRAQTTPAKRAAGTTLNG